MKQVFNNNFVTTINKIVLNTKYQLFVYRGKN